jgi:hypothetical protein
MLFIRSGRRLPVEHLPVWHWEGDVLGRGRGSGELDGEATGAGPWAPPCAVAGEKQNEHEGIIPVDWGWK